jgi:CDGSH-type Zn-finger protein
MQTSTEEDVVAKGAIRPQSEELQRMKEEQKIEAGTPANGGGCSIIIDTEGPYFVYGSPELKQEFIVPNAQGEAWEYKDGITFKVEHEPMVLCRCGHSRSKPFCDGTHTSADWDPTLRADRTPLLAGAMTHQGTALDLADNIRFCVHARFCMAKGSVWELIEHSEEKEAYDLSIRETFHCPSGRLKIKEKGKDVFLEPHLAPSLSLIEDPQKECSGPLWVKGGIPMEDCECNPFEIRNRVTLCRCGSSKNKPYCDGNHMLDGFQDGLPPLPAE